MPQIYTVSKTPPSVSTGADVNKGAPITPAEFDQMMVNLQAAILAIQYTGFTFKGAWNASTNSPTIPTAASGNANWEYLVAVGGTATINGVAITFSIGDMLISNGSTWQRVPAPIAPTSLAQLTDWPTGLSASNLAYIGNLASDAQTQLNGKLSANMSALLTMILSTIPNHVEFVVGGSTDGGNTPDAQTQASINNLLSLGVQSANIKWIYTGAASSSLVIANAVSASSSDNITLAIGTGAFLINNAASSSTSDNVVMALAGGTLAINNATSASTADNFTLSNAAGGTFSIQDAISSSTSDNVTITTAGGGTFAINSATSASTADNVVMSQASASAPVPDTFYSSSAIASGANGSISGVSTSAVGELVVVVIAKTAVNTNNSIAQSASITASGVTLSLKSAQNVLDGAGYPQGQVEVWTGIASGTLSSVTVAQTGASAANQGPGRMWVATFSGASGVNVPSGNPGVFGDLDNSTQTYAAYSITPVQTNSLLYFAGIDVSALSARTILSGQTLLNGGTDSSNYYAWIQSLNTATNSLSAVNMGTSAPNGYGQMIGFEVKH